MGLGGVAIVILPSIMCLKLTFSDGLGGGFLNNIEDEEVYVLLSKPYSPNKPKVRTLQCLLVGCTEESGLLFYYIAKGYV